VSIVVGHGFEYWPGYTIYFTMIQVALLLSVQYEDDNFLTLSQN